jgi:predicted enzyme related to lactoylglutathione lyase
VDYSAADLPAAQQFYGDVLGWSYTDGSPEFGGYLTCLLGDRAAAGMAPRMDPSAPPSWTTYFATEDADASVVRITDAGGTVVAAPMDVGSMGRMAMALDPQGHFFGLWQSGDHTGVTIFNEPGALTWNDAAVEDVPAAQSFYREAFGFRFDDLPDMGGYATFATDGEPLGGLGGPRPGTPPGWTTCFAVASTDDAVATTQAAGGTVAMPAQDTEFGRFAVVGDPWGAPFSVMQAPPG